MTLTSHELLRTPNDNTRWDNLLLHDSHANYMSNLDYEYSKDSKGRVTTGFVFSQNSNDIAGCHYSIKKSAANLISVSDIKSGVHFSSEPNPNNFKEVLDHYLNWAKRKNVSYARINSWLPKIVNSKAVNYSIEIEELLKSKGFTPVAKPKHTYWIDLTQPEEVLLEKMKRQTRYDARQGEKNGIEIQQFTSPDEKSIDAFLKLYNSLGNQKGFEILAETKIKSEIYFLLTNKLATLFLLTFNGVVVNASIVGSYGYAQYLYGAINPNFKQLKGCPPPGAIAQWEMIKEMKRRGLALYDMGFCPGSVPDPNHPKYPIWRFKYGFGGEPVEFLPVYGKVIQPIRGRLFYFLNVKK